MLGNHLTFIDSFQFMSSSLDKLVSNLPSEALKYTNKQFKGGKFELMTRKGVYPYDYMDSFEKFILKLINYSYCYQPTRTAHSGQVDEFRNPMKNELKTTRV